MTPTTPAEIDALLALEEGMTKGPWAISKHSVAPHELDIEIRPGCWFLRVSPGYPFSEFPDPAEVETEFKANARAIAALPQLFTTLRALYARAIKAEGERDAARAALRRCRTVLGNMAEEREGAIFNRWPINHEPLRADARGLLPVIDDALDDVP